MRLILWLLAIFAPLRGTTLRAASATSSDLPEPDDPSKPFNAQAAYEALKREFPGEGYFPPNFIWQCPCNKGVAGFPGCNNREHFLDRVYLALVDYHQERETREHSSVEYGTYQGVGHLRFLRTNQFTEETRRRLQGDLDHAAATLMRHGIQLELVVS
jgi:hypothetical protein